MLKKIFAGRKARESKADEADSAEADREEFKAGDHADPDLVPVGDPGHPFGVGNPNARYRVGSKGFGGAHVDNHTYFERVQLAAAADGEVLRLKSVCWLGIGATVESVPAGSYEAVLRCRMSELKFVGEWRVGVGVGSMRGWPASEADQTYDDKSRVAEAESGVRPLLFRNHHTKGRAGASFQKRLGKWTNWSMGTLILKTPASVRFQLNGGNPSWAGGVEWDFFELRMMRLPWSVLRLLELCRRGKETGHSVLLGRLPGPLLDEVLTFLGHNRSQQKKKKDTPPSDAPPCAAVAHPSSAAPPSCEDAISRYR